MAENKYKNPSVEGIANKINALQDTMVGQPEEVIKGHILQIFKDAGISEESYKKLAGNDNIMVTQGGQKITETNLDKQVGFLAKAVSRGELDTGKENEQVRQKPTYCVVFSSSDKERLKKLEPSQAKEEIMRMHEMAASAAGWTISDLNSPCNQVQIQGYGQMYCSSEPYLVVMAEHDYNKQVLGMTEQQAMRATEKGLDKGAMGNIMAGVSSSSRDYSGSTMGQSGMEMGMS